MHPIFWPIRLTPQLAQVLAIIVLCLLSIYIVYDARKSEPAKSWGFSLGSAAAFFAVGALVIYRFVDPKILPAEVPIDIRSWGVMVVFGMVSCFMIQRRLSKPLGLTGDQVLSIWVYGGICAIIGARSLHVLVNYRFYAQQPISAFTFWDGGSAFIGGALAAILFAAIYLKKHHPDSVLTGLDALVLGMALTHGFGRLGCFFAGCCYGQASDLPWAVQFPPGSIAQSTMAFQGRIGLHEHTYPVHPTQLYESAMTFVLGFALLAWYRRRPAPGTIIWGYLGGYLVIRFFIEMLRDDPEREFLLRIPEQTPLLLSTTQTIGLAMLPVVIYQLWKRQRGPQKHT